MDLSAAAPLSANRASALRRHRARNVIGTAIYLVFLLVAQFEHHDLLCHIKTPQHCTTCALSLVGSDPSTLTQADTSQLADAGRTHAVERVAESTLLSPRSTGRSPPSSL